MSYTQFGYSYPSSSQLLMTGQHPTPTPCCQSANTGDPHGAAPQPTPAAAAVCTLPAAYDSRLLSTFPRLATGLTVNGLYGSSYADQGYVTALGTNPSAFYSSLPNPYDLKDSRTTWAPLPQATAAACYPYDPTLAAYGPYGDRYGTMDSVARRKNATRETTNTLKAWLYEHRKNPYPTKGEKIMLAIITKMTLTQVSTWFANARRRLKKENKMTWEPRNKSGESADAEDKGDNSSSPSPCDNMDKKSHDDSLDGCQDDDSQDIHVKTESDAHVDNRSEIGDLGSCSVKSESSDILSNDCLTLNLGNYGGHTHHLTGCSPNSDTRPCGTPSPVHPHQLHPHHHQHHHDHHNHHHHPHHPHHPQQPTGTGVRLSSEDQMTLDVVNGVLSSDRPKIWSLAHTATSDSPPMLRRAGSLSQMVMTPDGYMVVGNNTTSSSSSSSSLASSTPSSMVGAGTATGGGGSAGSCSTTPFCDPNAAVAPGGGTYTPGGAATASTPAPSEQPNDLSQHQPAACWLNGGGGGGNGTAGCSSVEVKQQQPPSSAFGGSACSGVVTRDCAGGNLIPPPLQSRCSTSSSPSASSSVLSGKTLMSSPLFDPRLSAEGSDLFAPITPSSTSDTTNHISSVPKMPSRLGGGLYGPQMSSTTSPNPHIAPSIEFSRPPPPLIRGPVGYLVDDGNTISPSTIMSGLDPTSTVGHHVAEQKDYISGLHVATSLGTNLNSRYNTTAFRPVAKTETSSV